MYFTVLRNSMILTIGYYLSIIFLPEILKLNSIVSECLFFIPAGFWIMHSTDKWWINTISILLAVVLSLPLIDGFFQ
jgi:putative effector of murein hydrolase LrgA (UPF0299 family)